MMQNRTPNISLTILYTLLLFLAVGYTACNKEPEVDDSCKYVNCDNNAPCSEGKCICAKGYEGERCENKWSVKFRGVWKAVDVSSSGKQDTFTVAINPSLTNAADIVIDKFWIYAADGIVADMAETNSFTFKTDQNIRPGHFDIYMLKSGDGTIDKSGTHIDGSYIINDPQLGEVSYTYHMTRGQ